MIIDTVIPVFRPDDKLKRCVNGLLEQTVFIRNVHLIISYVYEEDKKCAEDYQVLERVQIRYIKQSAFDYASVKDDWMQKTDAEYILFMTQDGIPADSTMLEHLLKAFEDERTAVAYGRHITDEGCGEIERFTRYFNYPPQSVLKNKECTSCSEIKLYFNSNVCALYRLANYRRAGGFGRRAISSEDMMIAWKVITSGEQVAYVAEAEVLHYHSFGLGEQFRRNFDIGVAYSTNQEIRQALSASHEGVRLVLKTAEYLIKQKKMKLLFPLFLQSGVKYMGYQMGRHYQMLPYKLKILCTRNKGYWKEE